MQDYRSHLSNHLDESESWEFGTGQVLTGPCGDELKPTKPLIEFKSKSRSERLARVAANAKHLVEISAADPSYPAGVISRMRTFLMKEQFDKIFELALKVDPHRRELPVETKDIMCPHPSVSELYVQKNEALDADDYDAAKKIATQIENMQASKHGFRKKHF